MVWYDMTRFAHLMFPLARFCCRLQREPLQRQAKSCSGWSSYVQSVKISVKVMHHRAMLYCCYCNYYYYFYLIICTYIYIYTCLSLLSMIFVSSGHAKDSLQVPRQVAVPVPTDHWQRGAAAFGAVLAVRASRASRASLTRRVHN